MVSEIERIANSIRVICGPEGVVGASSAEVDELMALWQADRFPASFAEFLLIMGRGAGKLLVGTDIFLPRIKKLPVFTQEFFVENGDVWRLPAGAMVFAMHQGYQLYYLENVDQDDPPVALYMEGEQDVMQRWGSFTGFLREQFDVAFSA